MLISVVRMSNKLYFVLIQFVILQELTREISAPRSKDAIKYKKYLHEKFTHLIINIQIFYVIGASNSSLNCWVAAARVMKIVFKFHCDARYLCTENT